jgi:hypothetical protein
MQRAALTPAWESITYAGGAWQRGRQNSQATEALRGRPRLMTVWGVEESAARRWRYCCRSACRRVPSAMERQIRLSDWFKHSAICVARSGGNGRSPRAHNETVVLETGGSSCRPRSMKSHPCRSQRSRRLGSYRSCSSDTLVTLLLVSSLLDKGWFCQLIAKSSPPNGRRKTKSIDNAETSGYNLRGKLRLLLGSAGRKVPGPKNRTASTHFFGCTIYCGRWTATKRALASRTADEQFQKERSRRMGVFCFNYRPEQNRCQALRRGTTGETAAGHGQQREKSNEGTLQPIGVGQRTLIAITARLGKEAMPSQDLSSCPPRRSIVLP